MTAPANPLPLAVWDCNGDPPFHKWEHLEEAVAWNQDHLPDRGNDTYRLEFYLIDAPFAVAYRYAINEDGRLYMNPETGKPAVEEPVVVILDSLPPAYLRVFQ